MTKCPYCAKQIQGQAIVCPYCGYDLTKPVTMLPTVSQGSTQQLNKAGGAEVLIGIFIILVVILCIVLWAFVKLG